jgi:UDP-3-O-[3-hydroxymyristoyl] glucosamine N-acyltransferase
MITLANIIDYCTSNFRVKVIINCDTSIEISNPSELLENNQNESLLFWVNSKNIHKIASLNTGTLISPIELDESFNFKGSVIVCDDPRYVFSSIIKEFWTDSTFQESAIIGAGTIIEPNVFLGKNVKIGYNNVIHSGTIISNNVTIGSNNTIGGVGFGYAKNIDGEYEVIPHIGGVIIEESVEIGNNTCIDRAVLGNTIIRKNCKIDNLVHIAHGVEIGENSLIIANSMIAGSVKIGSNTWIAPSTSIINGTSVGNNSMTGLGSVVINKIADSELFVGVPAKKIKDL